MPPAETFICNRTVKKRRGYYSEQDVFLSPCPYVYGEGGMYESTYYGVFDLSNSKYITVPTSTKYEKTATRVYFISGGSMITSSSGMKQAITLELIPDPNIIINDDLGVISDSCNINYRIPDSNTSVKFDVTEKLNGVVISKKNYALDGNYTLNLTDEHLSTLSFNSTNNITIELSTYQGGKFLEKTVTFTKGNTKPKLDISSYNSTSATFTAIDTDNNLSKIEWYLDDVLKETITTDLYLEKTINYELTDNAIHTLKIVATDAENATVEKVLSISKEIMPLQEDANLSDISTKLAEIGEGFKNGKTSIINTLALKNIDASLNNTLVELSEKIKQSFDSGDASLQDLTNKLTQANNTISQLNSKYKVASGNSVVNSCVNKYGFYHGSDYLFLFPGAIQINGLNFVPNIFFTTFELIDSGYFRKFFVFACRGIFTQDFVITAHYHRLETYLKDFKVEGEVLKLNERDVYMDNRGIQLPCQRQGSSFKWQAIKFI
ncbi:TPA: hypothetical protein MIY32_002721 [Clostridioides difficile]|uniref:hypothetical protein n=1 Tax=Clostridioides difficile TaxID=1496 RepID=UPI00097FEAEF|nr:hypothetical protein [Clostridioides difficile]MCA0747186.1 hypothetical protein [Clostridioides difficile]SJP51731.1 Uncharacterised protein [Clostridioides difficile]HBF5741905.1 hypothetical protein [Clostridioides difficile]HBF6260202.1 hypothetical protein [Clostridioides difficile]HBF7221145.1 hypothetical protein [Clostridioides difficile]